MRKINYLILVFFALLIVVPSYAIEGTNETIKLNSRIYDELETYDEVDYFNFKLSNPGSVKIDFEFDVEGRYYVKLIEVNENIVIQNLTFESQVNTSTGRYSKSGSKVRLDEGRYQISVSTSSYYYSDEEYKLKVSYDSESSNNYEKENNDSAKTSMIIDVNRRVTGNLQSTSDVDFYMVELDYPGSIEIKMQYEKNAKYYATLYSEVNGTLSQIQSTSFYDEITMNQDKNTQLSNKIRVVPGYYYIKVSNGSWNNYTDSDYTLTVVYDEERYGNYERESNNEANLANNIYEGEKIIGNMESTNDYDYYYISLWRNNKYYINMDVPVDAEYNVAIYKENNGKLQYIVSERISESQQYMELDNVNGDYYIRVSSRKFSNRDYTIEVINENDFYIPKHIVLKVNDKYMHINGEKTLIDGNRGTTPIIVEGRVLLPIRAVIENLGGNVMWDDQTNMATFELKDRFVNMQVNSTRVYVNGIPKYVDVPIRTINGRTMVPVRFIIENLGGSVIWDNSVVTIEY